MDNKKVRGCIINGYLSFIEMKWGRFGKEECLENLEINGKIKDGYYYPNKIKISILRWIKENKGENYIEDAGKYLIKNLRMLSWLVRYDTPFKVAKKIEKEFEEIYTFGKMKIRGEKGKINVFLQTATEDDVTCLAYKGVLKGILEKTNYPGTVDIKYCKDKSCEYEVRY